MFQTRRPTEEEIAARLTSPGEFSYPEVGATNNLGPSPPESIVATYDLDRHEFPIGAGRDLFDRARDSLLAWRHFEIPWLEFHGGSAPVRTGQVVATLVSGAGFWFLNPCRVVYTELTPDEGDIAAFAYGTLSGHAECGEERFQVSFNRNTGEVDYKISAFSRPAILLAKLGYPFARKLQRRFAEASAKALVRAAT